MRQLRAFLRIVSGVLFAALVGARATLGQAGAISGAVRDSATGAALSGVFVAAVAESMTTPAAAITDGRGRFHLTGLLPASYTLVLRRVGYAPRRVPALVPAGSSIELELLLAPVALVLDPIQVTASRMPEAALDAPAAVSVVDRPTIPGKAGFTPIDYVRTVPGMDFASKGLVQHSFAVRGVRPATNGAMLMLTDGRRAALPATGVNLSYLLPSTKEDLARIEVVRGPGAALYGPGAARGVLQVVSRSPFDSPGAFVSLAAGGRDLFEGTGRLAVVVSPRLAFKVSAAWLQGHDWENLDSLEVRARRNAIARGADPDTLLVGSRDFHLRRATTEARVEWRPDSATTVTSTVGLAQAGRVIDLTDDLAAVQLQDWRYGFAQTKLQRGRLLANVTYNLSDAGDTYLLRSGLRLVDDSRQATAQVQHGADAGHVDLVYGLDGRWTDPRTGGTFDGRNEADDQVAEVGGYLQARASALRWLDLVAAVRADRNNRLNDLAVSPRAAAVMRPAAGHTLRLTYNRAFTAPEATALFLDIPVPGWPFAVRQVAIPQNGFSFRRNCSGICMRSPYNPAGRDRYLAADATLVWDSVVALLERAGEDLSDIPRPGGSEVGTRLAELAGSPLQPRFDPMLASAVVDLPGRRRAIYQTLEFGYRRVATSRGLVSVDVYLTSVKNPVGGVFTVTPSVFYDSTSLAEYLKEFRAPQEAARLAGLIDTIRVGVVTPQEARDPLEMLRSRRQGGGYSFWGSDASITMILGSEVEVTATYSWVSRNVLLDVAPDEPTARSVVLHAPRHKGALTVQYRRDGLGLVATLGARAVGGFPTAASGDAAIPGYVVLDGFVAYQLPWRPGVGVSVSASNLLDHRHREIDAAPVLGRLLVARVETRF